MVILLTEYHWRPAGSYCGKALIDSSKDWSLGSKHQPHYKLPLMGLLSLFSDADFSSCGPLRSVPLFLSLRQHPPSKIMSHLFTQPEQRWEVWLPTLFFPANYCCINFISQLSPKAILCDYLSRLILEVKKTGYGLFLSFHSYHNNPNFLWMPLIN